MNYFKIIKKFFLLLILVLISYYPAKAQEIKKPLIVIDAPTLNSLVKENIYVRGWALNASGVKQVDILVDGKIIGQANIGGYRPDVNKVYPGYPEGDRSGYSYNLNINNISSGIHTITVKAIGNDGTSSVASISINIQKLNPIMVIDAPKQGEIIKNNLEIRGWALNASGVKQVDILVDGKIIGQANIGGYRPDVNKVYPGYPEGDRSGYSYNLNINNISSGIHTITVKAIGNDGTSSVASISINIQKLNPIMVIDAPKQGEIIKNNLEIRGWALNASGVKQIDILVDGKIIGQANTGGYRPDVNKAYPGYPDGDKSGYGYNLNINNISPGIHTITVKANGNDGTSSIASTSINIKKPNPIMVIDAPRQGETIKNDLEIRGWALNASGVKQIDILVDGKIIGQANTGGYRPDVNKAYPGYPDGDKSGYSYILKFDSISIGPHKLTVQAIGNDGTKIEQSVNFQKGNVYVTYTNYPDTFDDFVNKQIGKTPALQVKNANGIYEWRYAIIQNGQQGYYITVYKKNPDGSIAKDENGNNITENIFFNNPAQYNAIKQEIINKADPITLSKDETQIYQFVKLSYVDGISASDLNDIFNPNGVLNGKGQVFIDAAKAYNVNPVYLAAHAIHETGNGTSDLAKGIIVNGVKVYNLFGIGAVDSNPNGGGAQTAYNNGWDTIDKAIYGGAKWISNGYINAGQDTLYKMRWNPSNPTVHQYATDVKWAYNQAFKYKEIFDSISNIKLVFEIPKFK